MILQKHNHGANYGAIVAGCLRCQQLLEFPYVVKFKLAKDRRIQKLPCRDVEHAKDLICAQLPARIGDHIPTVETPSGEVVAILRFS